MFTPVLDCFLRQHEKLFVIIRATIWYAVTLLGTAQLLSFKKSRRNYRTVPGMDFVLANNHHHHHHQQQHHDDEDDGNGDHDHHDDDDDDRLTVFLLHVWRQSTMPLCARIWWNGPYPSFMKVYLDTPGLLGSGSGVAKHSSPRISSLLSCVSTPIFT